MFGTKTVNDVLKSFKKVVTDLRTLEKENQRKAGVYEKESREYTRMAGESRGEANKAAAVASKIEKLISEE